MADAEAIVARLRSIGGNLELTGQGLRIVNRSKLPAQAVDFILRNKAAIIDYLRDEEVAFEERAAIIEFDGGAPREWAEQFARLLIKTPSPKVDRFALGWFLTRCGEILDEAPLLEESA